MISLFHNLPHFCVTWAIPLLPRRSVLKRPSRSSSPQVVPDCAIPGATRTEQGYSSPDSLFSKCKKLLERCFFLLRCVILKRAPVNGEQVESCKVSQASVIELGEDQYRINLSKLLKLIGFQPTYSIKHLRRVWERYDKALLRLQLDDKKKQNQQKLQGIVSQVSMLCVIIPSVMPTFPIPPWLRAVLVVGALGMGIYFYMKGTSLRSVLLPFCGFVYLGCARVTKQVFSRMLNTGIQYLPVDSIQTSVQEYLASQSDSSLSPLEKEEKRACLYSVRYRCAFRGR